MLFNTSRLVFLIANLMLLVTYQSTYAQVGSPFQISGEQVPFGDVKTNFQISPDGQRVVYRADQDTDGVIELFSVPITGGTAVKLNPPIANSRGGVSGFAISPDGQRVVYMAKQDGDGFVALFSVPITGDEEATLLAKSLPGQLIDSFQIANSQRVLYRIRNDAAPFIDRLFSRPITGGMAVSLVPSGVDLRSIDAVRVSGDGLTVVYSARVERGLNQTRELLSVSINGGNVVTLNFLNSGTSNLIDIDTRPVLSLDSQRVVFLGRVNGGLSELFSVPIAGGTPIRLTPPTVSGLKSVLVFKTSPDSRHIVFLAETNTESLLDLFSVPTTGGAVVKLNNPTEIAFSKVKNFTVSPDSQRVVYFGDQGPGFIDDAFSVPITGGDPQQLSRLSPFSGVGVAGVAISPDSQTVVLITGTAFPDLIPGRLLSSVPITPSNGNTHTTLSPLFFDTGNLRISPDGKRVIFAAAEQESEGPEFELFSVLLDGSNFTKLNDELPFGGAEVNSFQISPDGAFVVYHADQDVFDEDELFAHRLTQPDSEICIPIRAKNGKLAVVCL